MITALSREELPVRSEDDVVAVRRRAQTLAQQSGFDPFATAAVTTATSELSRNIVRHAGAGQATLEQIRDERRAGLRIEFRDEGPGIVNLDRALQGGYSTTRTLGLGLSGSRRLVDHFHIQTEPGRGTVVTIVKWARY